MDKKVFEIIRSLVPSDGSIAFVRQNNFAGFSFASDHLNQLEEFRHWAALPDSEFLDADLESLRSRLHKLINGFLGVIYTKTFSTNRSGFVSVPAEWEDTYPDMFRETVETIHRMASEVCEAYDGLIRTCRRKLNVP